MAENSQQLMHQRQELIFAPQFAISLQKSFALHSQLERAVAFGFDQLFVLTDYETLVFNYSISKLKDNR